MIKFLIKMIKSFFKNFEKVDESYFENNFNLFKRAKSHVWTHVAMLLAWSLMLILTVFLPNYKIFDEIISFFALMILSTISYPLLVILFIIENTFYPKYKLKRRFIYENPLFSIIWLIGQLFLVLSIIFIILCSLDIRIFK